MKTIAKLKKEIGCKKRVMYVQDEVTKFFTCGEKKKCYNCELKEIELQTLQNVCEEIENLKIPQDKDIDAVSQQEAQLILIEELLKKFQGGNGI